MPKFERFSMVAVAVNAMMAMTSDDGRLDRVYFYKVCNSQNKQKLLW